jgi:PadR family transcriptional regulator PadR
MYGLQLVASSKGRLKRGTVYVTLGRMEEKGLVTSRLDSAASETGGLPRRLYKATGFGSRVWHAWSEMVRVLRLEPAR